MHWPRYTTVSAQLCVVRLSTISQFHLYIGVISCTRGAMGYFTFILVLYHAPEAPWAISPLYWCYIMHQRRHGLFHHYIGVISCTRGAMGSIAPPCHDFLFWKFSSMTKQRSFDNLIRDCQYILFIHIQQI